MVERALLAKLLCSCSYLCRFGIFWFVLLSGVFVSSSCLFCAEQHRKRMSVLLIIEKIFTLGGTIK